MHEAVFEDGLGDDGDAVGLRHDGHVLGLQVCGETGVLFGGHIDGAESAARFHAQGSAVGLGNPGTSLSQFRREGTQMFGDAAGNVERTTSHQAGDDEGSGLNAVGDDFVVCAVEFGNTLHTNGAGSRAFQLGTHFDQKVGQIDNFRFPRGILNHSLATSQRGGHQNIFGAGDGNAVKHDVCAAQAIGGGGFDVAVVLRDDGTQTFEA